MLAALDAHYPPSGPARAACVLFEAWTSDRPSSTRTAAFEAPAEYAPGALYLRELPGLLRVLAPLLARVDLVVVDAYVTLDPAGKPGLGARLREALPRAVPVVGVAKTRYAAATMAIPVLRGRSAQPLWVTAAGIDPEEAAEAVRSMHGAFRVPALLKEADRLARAEGGAA